MPDFGCTHLTSSNQICQDDAVILQIVDRGYKRRSNIRDMVTSTNGHLSLTT